MLVLGYIISDTKYNGLNEDILKIVTSIEDCVFSVPRLIVGLKNARDYAAKNGWSFDILENTFPNGDMWTFKKTEKRECYEEMIDKFREHIIRMTIKQCKYSYIEIFRLNLSHLKRLYDRCCNNPLHRKTNYIVIKDDMIYFDNEENGVMGINLANLEYCGIKRENILKKLKFNKQNRIIYPSNPKISNIVWNFYESAYILPYLLNKGMLKM